MNKENELDKEVEDLINGLENRDMEGRNETGKVINPLAKELIAPAGDSIDLTEDLMNKKGGKGLYEKSNMSPGKPNMNPRRPGMKWDI